MGEEKKTWILCLLIVFFLCILGLTFFHQLTRGSNTLYADDATGYGYDSKLTIKYGTIWHDVEDMYPPGISILFASGSFVDVSMITYLHIIRLVYSLLVFILSFILARILINIRYALATSFFVAFPLTVWSRGIEESLYTFVFSGYQVFSGTSMDVIPIMASLLLILLTINDDKNNTLKYLTLFIIIEVSHGIMHISRWVAFIGPLLLLFMILAIYVSIKKQNTSNHYYLLMIIALLATIILTILLLYGWRIEDISKTIESYNIQIIQFQFIIVIFTALFIIASTSYLISYRKQEWQSDRISIIIYNSRIFLLYFTAIIVIGTLIVVSIYFSDLIIIAGPFFFNDILAFFSDKPYGGILTLNSVFGIYLLLSITIGLFLMIYYNNNTLVFSLIFIVSSGFYLGTLILDFHSHRMNLHDYFRPFFLGMIVYSIINRKDTINFPIIKRDKINKVLTRKSIKVILIGLIIFANGFGVFISTINDGTKTPEDLRENPIMFLQFGPSLKIHTTGDFVNNVYFYIGNNKFISDSRTRNIFITYSGTSQIPEHMPWKLNSNSLKTNSVARYIISPSALIAMDGEAKNDFDSKYYCVYCSDLNQKVLFNPYYSSTDY